MMPAGRPITDVAVGIVVDSAGRVLVGQRVPGKPYPGWWEFPGGKFEPGEDAHAALVRELDEELGLLVTQSDPWVVREHVYEHAHVRLHFRRVHGWQGRPSGREGQAFRWCAPEAIDVAPLLPAALAPARWLSLPGTYAISAAAALGEAAFLARLEERLDARHAGQTPLRLLQLREPDLAVEAVERLLEEILARARGRSLRVLVSSRHPLRLAERAAERSDGGRHLTGRDLAELAERGRPDLPLLAASCHRPAELALAGQLGLDFAVLGPVAPTASHPGAAGLGWASFGRAVADTPVPTYALGGLTMADLATAMRTGAHGVALLRAAWVQDTHPAALSVAHPRTTETDRDD